MSLHAPNVMRWTPYMDECIEALETSPAAMPSDKVLCQHVRLQHLVEDFETQLSQQDSSFPSPSHKIEAQVIHEAFKRQLANWSAGVSPFVWNGKSGFHLQQSPCTANI